MTCEFCKKAPAAEICCSSHAKNLCHRCYRVTHFCELCVAGCSRCAAEGLPVNLRCNDCGHCECCVYLAKRAAALAPADAGQA